MALAGVSPVLQTSVCLADQLTALVSRSFDMAPIWTLCQGGVAVLTASLLAPFIRGLLGGMSNAPPCANHCRFGLRLPNPANLLEVCKSRLLSRITSLTPFSASRYVPTSLRLFWPSGIVWIHLYIFSRIQQIIDET